MHRDQDLTAPNQPGSMSKHMDQGLTALNILSNMSTHQINSDQLKNNAIMETNQEYYHLDQ